MHPNIRFESLCSIEISNKCKRIPTASFDVPRKAMFQYKKPEIVAVMEGNL
jgi:hypothetical protein